MSAQFRIAVEGPADEEALRSAGLRAREAAVLELYRLGRITSGRAAAELGIDRGAFLAFAASRGVATLQVTPEELREEADALGG